jgi:hypothetical protein
MDQCAVTEPAFGLLELVAPGVLDDDVSDLAPVLERRGINTRTAYQREVTRGRLDLAAAALVAGRLPFVLEALRQRGVPVPAPLDYLDASIEALGRRVWPSTLGAVRAGLARGDEAFVKPRGVAKSFTGRVVASPEDLFGIRVSSPNTQVWCSEPVHFRAEHRVFLVHSKIVAVTQYDGYHHQLDLVAAEMVITSIRPSLPAGCAVDLGTLDTGQVVLVEANDGFSLGRYGLEAEVYCDLLLARWSELTSHRLEAGTV